MSVCHPQQSNPGFRSWKNDLPIFFTRRWLRYALVRLLVDPDVISFAADDTPIEGALLVVRVRLRGGDVRVVFYDAEDLFTQIPHEFGPHVVMTRADVLAEPRLTTLRMLWSKRRASVSPRARTAVYRALRDAPGGVGCLADVIDAIGRTSADGLDVVAALAMRGVLTLDLTTPLGPSTPVRLTAGSSDMVNRPDDNKILTPKTAAGCRTLVRTKPPQSGVRPTAVFAPISTRLRFFGALHWPSPRAHCASVWTGTCTSIPLTGPGQNTRSGNISQHIEANRT